MPARTPAFPETNTPTLPISMSYIYVMAVVAYAVVSVLLCAAALRSRSRFLVFALHFLPFLFLFGFLWISQSGYKTLQVRKLGYEFEKATGDYRNPARAVTLGGNRDRDDLYFENLPQGAVRITPSLHGTSVDVESVSGGVLIERNGSLLNSMELRDGDTIEMNSHEARFHGGGSRSRTLTAGESKWEWPHKPAPTGKLRRADLAGSLEEQFYPLTRVGVSLGFPVKSAAVLGLEGLRFERSRRPLTMNAVYLAAYDAGITVNRKPLPSKWSCNDGDVLRFFVLEDAEGTLRARRVASFVIRNHEFLAFLKPNAETLGMRDELLQGSGSAPLLLTTTRLPYSAFPAITYSDESARFSGIVAFVQPYLESRDEGVFGKLKGQVKESLSLDVPRFEVVTDDGTFRPLAGERIALGSADRMLFTLDQTRFPWVMFNVLLIFLVIRALFHAPVFRPIENHAASLILVLIDFFLTTRLLFAFRASALYPFSQEAVPLALLGFLLVPYLLFAAALLMRSAWKRTEAMHFAAYTILMAASGAYLLPAYGIILAGIAIVVAAAAFLMKHPRSPLLGGSVSTADWLSASSEVYVALLVFAALVLKFAGIGEALNVFGLRVPLALLYQPVLLWQAARVLADLRRRLVLRDDLTFRSVLVSGMRVLLVVAAYFVLGFLSSDFGFFLLYGVPVLFLLFGLSVLYIAEYELHLKAAGVALAIPIVGVLLLFSSYSTINRLLPQEYFNSRPVQRILLAVDPDSLEASGLVSAERQLGHQRMFLAYARSGWNGAGYGKRPISPALAATSLNDNVPSVFLLNDFGVAGFVGASLVLLMMAWLWVRALRLQPDGTNMPLTEAAMLSLVSLVTWLYTGFYMMFANCGILLFTGKNVFLWGLNSTSDLLQSSALLAFVIVPLSRASEAPASQAVALPARMPAAIAGEPA